MNDFTGRTQYCTSGYTKSCFITPYTLLFLVFFSGKSGSKRKTPFLMKMHGLVCVTSWGRGWTSSIDADNSPARINYTSHLARTDPS